MDISYVLKAPVITEKAASLMSSDVKKNTKPVFVCLVHLDADKSSIKKAVERYFKVEVEKVRVANIGARKRKFKGVIGYRKAKRKAYITLKEGQSINLYN